VQECLLELLDVDAALVWSRNLAIAQRDDDRRDDHDRRDGVRHDQHEIGGGDPVREPENEANKQDEEVPDRDAARAPVLDDLADLKYRPSAIAIAQLAAVKASADST
jgi:hypothetical protein